MLLHCHILDAYELHMFSRVMLQAVTTLTDMLRENFRNAKLKSVLLPALGELLFLMARVQEHCGAPASVTDSNKPSIPSLTFTMILKCLKEGVSARL